ncbi:MAG: 3-deoxy-7-phosphoheptulonate synthase class II [Pseudomonadota bacterium]
MNVKSVPDKNWNIDSWRNFPIKQQPEYKNLEHLREVELKLAAFPPLISPSEIRSLKSELADAAYGKAFLLQGGDCAESFAEFNEKNLRDFFRVMLQMTMALMYGAGRPVVKVGRIAGQFSKPRSENMEKIGDAELPSYRGDMVNSMEFDPNGRQADPERLLRAYYQGAATLNFLRTLARGGYASLRQINRWNMEFVSISNQGKRFEELVARINECLEFIRACRLPLDDAKEFSEASFFTSHEALLLGYESSLTRFDPFDEKYYACAAHMLWIGDRTRSPDEAHVEFLRGVANPIGCKVGPSTTPDGLLRLIDTLNPENEAGRLTLISRMGAGKVGELLPPLVRAAKNAGKTVIWACDPMHGNTIKSPNGFKTRKFTDILAEVRNFFDVHKAEGTVAGGVHFEMTGQDVTECLGGAQAISELNLSDRYHTHCDPRLNASQSLELAFLIAETIKKNQNR